MQYYIHYAAKEHKSVEFGEKKLTERVASEKLLTSIPSEEHPENRNGPTASHGHWGNLTAVIKQSVTEYLSKNRISDKDTFKSERDIETIAEHINPNPTDTKATTQVRQMHKWYAYSVVQLEPFAPSL